MKKYLAIIIAIFVGTYSLWVFEYNTSKPVVQAESAGESGGGVENIVTHPVATEVAEYVNFERDKAGLERLVDDPRLDASAAAKCNDMVVKNYWGHVEPDTGLHAWHFMTESGIPGNTTTGENLAHGFRSSQDTVQGWMNSPGHKANIERADYDHVGYAVCNSTSFIGQGYQDIIVQHFADLW